METCNEGFQCATQQVSKQMGTFWVLKGGVRQTAGRQRITSCVTPRDYRLQSSAQLCSWDFEFALKQKAKILLISPDLIFIYKTRNQDERKKPWTILNICHSRIVTIFYTVYIGYYLWPNVLKGIEYICPKKYSDTQSRQ